jgi:hypothetical protein
METIHITGRGKARQSMCVEMLDKGGERKENKNRHMNDKEKGNGTEREIRGIT